MAAQEVLNALNQIYDLGDSLDDAGIGTLALTNGNKTTREACRLDIAHFLVYVGNGGSFVTDAQASLLGIVLGSQYGQVTPEAFRNVAKDVGVPEAEKSLSILTFCHCDQVLSRKNGTKSTSLTDVLVNFYETVGQLMVALNENAVSRSRYDSYIREMKSVIASHLEDGDDSSGKAPTGKEAGTHEDGKKTKPSGKKKSSTKKMNSDRGAGTKAALRGKNMGRGQIPAGDVLIPGKYKGIHNVTGKPETISPFGSWTIDVPAGFSYTMDPECASRSMMGMGPSYSLQIQTTEDCDFSSAYDSSFGLAIYPSSVVWVNIEDGGEDLRSSYAQSTLRDLQNDGFRNYTVLVHTPDVLVQYDNSNRDSEAITINFQIICAGVNAGTNGQIDVQGPDMYKLEEKALEMLASVGSIHQEFNTDQYMPFAIPPKVSPIFKTPEVIEIAPAVKLPIPDGFHATKDQSQTNGRSFIIVPEAYPFSKDPMQATVGISGAIGQINLPDQYQYGTMLGMILSKLPDGVFTENSKMWFSRISDSYAAFFQENHDEDAPTWALYRILLFAGSQAFVLSMRINFGRVKLPFLATSIDARNIVRHWLYHIVAKDTSGKDIPVASPKVPDVFHEHLTLVSSGKYTTHRDADFVGQSIRMLMEKHDNTGNEAYGLMEIPKDSYKLDAEARRLATIFRMDENLFDPYRDTEAMIRLGMFQDVKMFHALRSLAWTVSCKADQEGRTFGSYGFEELKEIGEMINKSPLNYKTESWCSGLCSHYDWHVFYVPESYIESKCRGRTDLRLLCNKENRGGSSIHIISPLFNMMDRTNDIISRCEETLESLEALRKDLIDLLPVMQTIYDGFMEDRDRSQPLEGVLAEALTAWCALAIAAKEPFYSEEAADTPEADAGLDGPMERPTDDLDAAPTARKTSTVSKSVAKKPSGKPKKIASESTPKAKKAPDAKKPIANRELETITIPDGTTVIEKKAYKGRKIVERVVIPEGVTEIGEEAFRDCPKLQEVVFPNSLTTIGANAFYRCKKLESIVLPDNVTLVREGAFNGCDGMKSAVVSKGMIKLEKSMFYNCKKLETVDIPDSITEIGEEVFHNCEKLERISIPDSVKKIGANAFFCTGLTEVELPEGAQLEHDVFYGCKKLTEVSVPEGTTAIPKNLFKSCENLEKVNIPDTVTAIGDSAFYDCHRLAEIDLPEGVTEIEEYAFSGCGFRRITIPDGMQKIARNAFSSCVRLEHISIPEGVDSIGDWAFSYCENLKSVQFPKTLRSIGERAFSYCAKLARIDLPRGLETIGDHAFYECNEIKEVVIPDGVTKIGESAFQKCSALTRVTLPESLVSIGSYAFLDCKQLTSIRIPASVKEIGFWVGSHTTTDIIVEGRRNYVERYRLQRAFSSFIQWADAPSEPYRGNILDHEAGDVLDLHGARIVEENRFENDENNEIEEQIESGILVLPEGLTEIRHNAFNHCSMNAVVFPKSLRTIGDHSFEDCLFLQLIELQEGLETIESRAFSGNNKLTDVYLPDSLKTLWKDAFQDGFVKTGKHVTIHMSGALAGRLRYETNSGDVDDRLTAVKAFVIDGVTYDRLEDYRAKLAQEARAKQDQARREREGAERRAAEERKKAERERINAQIYDLSQEMDSLKGLFAGMKRKKLQKQIDELNERLRRLQ